MATPARCFIEENADGKFAVRTKEFGDSMGRRGLDKPKVCVFLILVAVGLLCVCALGYMLFLAPPHSNTTIKNGGYSLTRQDTRFSIAFPAECPEFSGRGRRLRRAVETKSSPRNPKNSHIEMISAFTTPFGGNDDG